MTFPRLACWVFFVLSSCRQEGRDGEGWWPDGSTVFEVLSLDVPQAVLERSSLEGRRVGIVEMVGGGGDVVWRRSLHGRHIQVKVSRDVIDGEGCAELFGHLVDGFSLRLGPPVGGPVRLEEMPVGRDVSLSRVWLGDIQMFAMCTERDGVGVSEQRVVKLVAVREYRDSVAEGDGGGGCVGACDVIDVVW